MREQLRMTCTVMRGGEPFDEPLIVMKPESIAILIDRLQVLFGRPAMISEGRGFAATITSEPLPVEVLKGIVEATRGLAGAPAPEVSPLPHLARRPEN